MVFLMDREFGLLGMVQSMSEHTRTVNGVVRVPGVTPMAESMLEHTRTAREMVRVPGYIPMDKSMSGK